MRDVWLHHTLRQPHVTHHHDHTHMVMLTVNDNRDAAVQHAATLHLSQIACAKPAVMGAIHRRRA